MTTSHPKIVLFHQDKTRLWIILLVFCELIFCILDPKIVLFHQDKTRLWMKLLVFNYTLVPCIVFNEIGWDQCELVLCIGWQPHPLPIATLGWGVSFLYFWICICIHKIQIQFLWILVDMITPLLQLDCSLGLKGLTESNSIIWSILWQEAHPHLLLTLNCEQFQ